MCVSLKFVLVAIDSVMAGGSANGGVGRAAKRGAVFFFRSLQKLVSTDVAKTLFVRKRIAARAAARIFDGLDGWVIIYALNNKERQLRSP